jgi:hypothetical protein
MSKTVKMARVNKMILKAFKGDKEAQGDVQYLLNSFMADAKDIENNWERGDLAGAVTGLTDHLYWAENGDSK